MPSRLSFPLLAALLSATATAQSPFVHLFDVPPAMSHRNMLFDRIGTDLYRVAGTLTVPDSSWIYRAEVDALGAVQNAMLIRCDSGTASQYSPIVLPTSDGGLLFSYDNLGVGTRTQTLLKLDAAGDVQWAQHYPDNYGIFPNDHIAGMVEKDGHYFLLGHRQDVPVNEGYASILLEVDSTGACVQLRTWAGGDLMSDLGRGLLRTAGNGLCAVSVQRPYFGQSSYPSVSVQRWDDAMQVQWSYTYSLGNYHYQNHALLLQDDGLMLTGQIRFNSGAGPFYPYMMRLDSTGQVLWARVILFTQMSPKTTVQEPDGTFTVLLYRDSLQMVVAHVDGNGALLSAIGTDALPTEAWPVSMERDAATGEHLVRGLEPGNGGSTYLARLDANGQYACGNQSLTWADSLVTAQRTAFPVSMVTSTLASYPIGWITAPVALAAVDACLSTAVSAQEQRHTPKAWPVPAIDEVFISTGAQPFAAMPYRIVDPTGRFVLGGTASPAGAEVVRVDVSALPHGLHTIVLQMATGPVHVPMVK